MRSRPDGFTEFVLARGDSLQRTAVLLTHDPHTAQDLVQTALVRAWRSWDRIAGEPEAFVRKILVNEFLRDRGRRWHAERPAEVVPEPARDDLHARAPADPADQLSQRLPLVAALAQLPERQRAVVVLRYFHDYTERGAAEALGISVGSVKTHHARALSALRLSGVAAGEQDGDAGAVIDRDHQDIPGTTSGRQTR